MTEADIKGKITLYADKPHEQLTGGCRTFIATILNVKNTTLGGYNSINEFVEAKLNKFASMEHTMGALYTMMFSEKENTMYETSVGYEIRKTTYGEVKTHIEARYRVLQEKLAGIPRDSIVGLYMNNSLDWIEMFWSILHSGYSVLLMNLRLDEATLEKTLADCGVKAVVTDGRMFSVPTITASQCVPSDSPSGNDISMSDVKSSTGAEGEGFGSTIYVMSSGTTANVKVCGYTAEEFYYQVFDSYNIIKKCELMKKHYEGELKQLTFLPFYHIFGLVAVYIWFAFFSRTFVELKNLEPETITNTIQKHKVTHIFAVPLFWEKVYAQAMKTIRKRGEKTVEKFGKGMKLIRKTSGMPGLSNFLSRKLFKEVRANMFGESISFMISGGSEIKPEILEFFNAIGYHLANGYGMSELGITSVNLDKGGRKLLEGFVGEPLASVEYRIGDDGNLFVRGKTIASNVFEQGQWRSVSRDEWFDTKDMACCEDGQYRLLGRRDDVVISSTGENLNPAIIEPVFEMQGIRNACLIGPCKNGVKVPVLVVSADKFITEKAFEELKRAVWECADRAGIGAELKDILFTTDELMSSEEFKLNRRKVRLAYENGDFSRIDFREPLKEGFASCGNAEAVKLRSIIAAALDKSETDIDYESDFFIDLGGTSIDYFSMICEVEEEFDVSVPDEMGTGLRSIQKICEWLDSEKKKM